MKKIGICGYYATGITDYGGQPVKTHIITDELKELIGVDQVRTLDTTNWKKRKVILFFSLFKMIMSCENIIILPAQNGIKFFVPMLNFFNIFFHRKLHYIVIGGWLPLLIEKNKWLKKLVMNFNNVYVETQNMKTELDLLGLNNTTVLPNFKRLNILDETNLIYFNSTPFKLCTFSRVMKEKGIEDAIRVVNEINEENQKVIFKLDIFGQIDKNYKDTFSDLQKNFPEYIKYKGIVNYNESVDVLKNYYCLLFPTYYNGEGFAGTILDAFASGIPVIATDWRYNSEIIIDGFDGFIYDRMNSNDLKEILINLSQNTDLVNAMKLNCLNRAKEYLPEVVMANLFRSMKL